MESDITTPGKCISAISAMQSEIGNARKTLMNAEGCIVNRVFMKEQLDFLEKNLPETVRKAAQIVDEEENIRRDILATKEEVLTAANNQARQTKADADTYARNVKDQAVADANALSERASNDANACVEAARAEAKRIIEEAEKKAAELVEEENIVRRARVESEELREKAQQDAAALRKNTLEYMDSLLAETDRSISDLLNNIRLERSEVRNRM